MSAIETTSDVAVVRVGAREASDGVRVIVHAIMIRDVLIGKLNRYLDSEHPDIQWQVCLFGSELFGFGMTPAEAVRDAFGDRLSKMQAAIDRAKEIAVEHGAEIMRQAEGLE